MDQSAYPFHYRKAFASYPILPERGLKQAGFAHLSTTILYKWLSAALSFFLVPWGKLIVNVGSHCPPRFFELVRYE